VTPGDLSAYRALPTRQRRAVRRAARRGSRGRFDPALAGPLLAFSRRRQRRTCRVLVLAIVLILASAAAAAWVFLRSGPELLLAPAAAGLLVGGLAGVGSEKRLRRAEEAEALAEHRARPSSGGSAAAPTAPASAGEGTGPAEPPGGRARLSAGGPAPVQDGDAARRRLARVLSGRPRTEGEASSSHPWD
jgi:peptidoglycan/LPS O-acetylase OafA/YrhL